MKVNTKKLIQRCMEKLDWATVNCRDSHIKYVFDELDRKTRLSIECKALKNLAEFYEKYIKREYWVEDIDDFIHKLEENEE